MIVYAADLNKFAVELASMKQEQKSLHDLIKQISSRFDDMLVTHAHVHSKLSSNIGFVRDVCESNCKEISEAREVDVRLSDLVESRFGVADARLDLLESELNNIENSSGKLAAVCNELSSQVSNLYADAPPEAIRNLFKRLKRIPK